MGTIIAFTLLSIVLIILCIALSKVSSEKEIYMSKCRDLDKSYRSVLNTETEKLNDAIKKNICLKEELDMKTKELDKKTTLLKKYENDHTHFVKEVPMKSLAFKTEIVVSRDLRNDKDYMKIIDSAACNKLAEAILKTEAYEVTEEFDAYYNQYKRRYVFRFFK